MFTTLLLATGLSAGQPPAPVYTQPQVIYSGQPGVAQTQPMPMPMTGAATSPQVVEEIKDAKEETPPPTPYLLERTLAQTRLGELMACRGIVIYGWTEMSYNASTASRSNAPVFMIDQANQYQMNQNWLHVEKTIDTTKDERQFGWAMDWILPGTDARTTVPRGLWYNQIVDGNPYPIDPFQFYVQAYLPGLGKGTTVKAGRFATHVGYELVQGPDTPFISRSYMFQYNPFTHTGVWATTGVGENWTVGYGASTGTDTFIQSSTNRFTFLGQLKWAPKDGPTSVAFNVVITDPTYIADQNFQLYNFYNLVVTRKIGEKLTYVLDAGYSHMDNFQTIGNVNWYGAANYLIFNHNDKWTSTLRAEVFEDTQGARTGFSGLYTEVTYGVAYKPCQSVIIRPSVRYDNNSQSNPFEGSQNLFTGTIDLIFRW